MTHGSLFSGIGGFDLAARWAGWPTAFQVEIDPWCRRILSRHFPNAQRHSDIREFNARPFRGAVDVISGGFPCQPYSSAGKRLGKSDDRHLWPEMLRVIREAAPRWIVGENVRGLVTWSSGLVFEEVQADLEAAGYQVQAFLLPAAGVDAPHERYRVWFVAHRKSQQVGASGQPREYTSVGNATNAGSKRLQEFYPSSCSSDSKQHSRCFAAQWDEWTTESPVRRMDDGIPHRMDRIRGLGNAIVPQVAWRIFDTINQYEQQQ